ncbi:MAG: alpha-L-fucosidase [Bacteroidota bacterium]
MTDPLNLNLDLDLLFPLPRRDFLRLGVATLATRGLLPLLQSDRPVPSPQQLRWQQWEMGMFIHFGVNTFTGKEWGDGIEDPAIFNPVHLDARQWMRAARSAGLRYAVLTAKHHDGFCLWPSKVTEHSVKHSPWRGGEGDVVREFIDAAREEGIGAGLYLSPWDRNAPSYGDTPRYNDFYIDQLTELLGWYGPLVEVWFDGANGEGAGGRRQVYDWPRIHRTVRRLQPDALIFSDAGPDIRWIGNERGIAGDPNWCTVNPDRVPEPGLSSPEIIDALQHGDPPGEGTVWRPGEAPVSIRPGWFWRESENEEVKNPDELLELYYTCVGRNANLLLNVPPTRDGLIADRDMKSLQEFGVTQGKIFGHDLAAGAFRHTIKEGVELESSSPIEFDTVVLREDISEGQSVSRFVVDAMLGERWREVAEGMTFGRSRIVRCERVRARRVRVRAVESVGPVRIGGVGLYLWQT